MQEMIDYPALYELAAGKARSYQQASPFPHIVLDDIIHRSWLDRALDEFPAPGQTDRWRRLHVQSRERDVQYGKLGLRFEHEMPDVLRQLIWELNSAGFIGFLERLTGIDGLLPDPSLMGGGLHQVLRGGLLGVHADFTLHRKYNLDRRLNILLFLNRDWQDEYGGNLELWSRDMRRCERNLRPEFGRCVIFNTDASSFHGHPRRLVCPEEVTRKSIALYYYSNGRADGDVPHTTDTDWQVLPDVRLPDSE